MALFPILGLIALLPLAIVDAIFLTETFLGLVRARRVPLPRQDAKPCVAIVMPAHDEQATLAAAADMLAALIAAGNRVVVVADNCGDATAATAAAAGCEVVERHDPLRRGKGYALAAGRDHLMRDPPDIAIVLDADCTITADAAALIAATAAAKDKVVQGAYLFRYDPLAPPKVQISNFAFAVKNLVRQRGARRLGAAAILAGSGMAFPWRLFVALDLATGNVVEDLALGIELVRRDVPPLFEEHAALWSDASNGEGTETQRARWEGGFIATARQWALPLLAEGVRHRHWARFWLGAHLLVPALSIVLVVNMLAFLLFAGVTITGLSPLPAACAAVLLSLIAVAVLAAWIAEGRRHMSAGIFLRIPLYLAWKLAMYARLLTGRRAVAWIRTERVRKD